LHITLPSAATSSEVVQDLLALIRSENLVAGDRLPSIRQLSARLGIRPHQVRDALLQAQMLGHVQVHPRSGAVVQALPAESHVDGLKALAAGALETGSHHLFHLLEARQLLEFEIVEQAARRRRLEDLLPARDALNAMNAIHDPDRRHEFVEHDVRFHLAIARVAGNPVLTAMLEPLLVGLRPYLCRLTIDAKCLLRTQNSHMEIYRALVAGDARMAREQMQDHLQLAYDNLLGEVQSLPAECRNSVVAQ